MTRASSYGLLIGVVLAALTQADPPAPRPITDESSNPYARLEELQTMFSHLSETLAPSVVSIRSFRRLPAIHEGHPPEKTADAVFHRTRDRLVPAAGSGVVIREDGKILTNEHVVQGAERIEVVLHDARAFEAVALDSDVRSDLAVVTIESNGLKPIRLGDLGRVRRGHWAIAMGNPYGFSRDGHAAMTYGIISALGRALPELDPSRDRYYGNLIQTDAEINPGNSGGPLFNMHGELIGINTAVSTRSGSSDGVGFAIPISARTRAIIDLLADGQPIDYGYLGVRVEDVTADDTRRETGALVTRVEPRTPAARAGLQAGDLITRFHGARVRSRDDLVRLVGATVAGHSIEVQWIRAGAERRCELRLDARNASSRPPIRLTLAWRGMHIGVIDAARRKRFDLDETAAGLVIIDVDRRTPAARVGLEPGCILERIGSDAVAGLDDLRHRMRLATGPVMITAGGRQITLPPQDDQAADRRPAEAP